VFAKANSGRIINETACEENAAAVRRRSFITFAEWYCKGKQYPGDSCVNAGMQHKIPHGYAADKIRDEITDFQSVQ